MFFRRRRKGMLRLYDYVVGKNMADFTMVMMVSIREHPESEDEYRAKMDLVRIFSENVRSDLESLMGEGSDDRMGDR